MLVSCCQALRKPMLWSVWCQFTSAAEWISWRVDTVVAGLVKEPECSGVPGPGECRGAVLGRNQLQLCGAGQTFPTDGQPVWWWEDSRSIGTAVCHSQVLGLLTVSGSIFTSSALQDRFPFGALTLLVGWREGHPACRKLGVGLLVVMIWLELCTSYSCSCHHHFHHP